MRKAAGILIDNTNSLIVWYLIFKKLIILANNKYWTMSIGKCIEWQWNANNFNFSHYNPRIMISVLLAKLCCAKEWSWCWKWILTVLHWCDPFSASSLFPFVQNVNLKHIVYIFRFKLFNCPNQGCSIQITRADTEHMQACQYLQATCLCGMQVRERDMATHKAICTETDYLCEPCSTTVKR